MTNKKVTKEYHTAFLEMRKWLNNYQGYGVSETRAGVWKKDLREFIEAKLSKTVVKNGT